MNPGTQASLSPMLYYLLNHSLHCLARDPVLSSALVHKLKLEVVNTYNVAFVDSLFSESINNTAWNKHSLEVLKWFIVIKVGVADNSDKPGSLNDVNIILTFDPPWDRSMMSEEALLELNLL